MKPHALAAALALVLSLHVPNALASSWTYRGSLAEHGREAQGSYGFRLSLHDAAVGGRRIGNEITLPGVKVEHGAFESEVDFGVDVAGYEKVWLAVEVQDASGAFVPIAQRDLIEPKALESGVCWDTGGNATVAGDFLGTTNLQPLLFKVNSVLGGLIAPNANPTFPEANNVVFGSPQNLAAPGVSGATIGGGGSSDLKCGASLNASCRNLANGNFATVGGGRHNSASAQYATVSGGLENTATGDGATVGGGSKNSAPSLSATVSGGDTNVASGQWSTIAGGESNIANGTAAAVVGGAVNSASGLYGVAVGGIHNIAGGDNSLAAGSGAVVRDASQTPGCIQPECGDHGSFVWADDSGGYFSTTSPKQFMVRAGGGAAINGAPINSQVELSIYPGVNSLDYVDIFMRQKEVGGGILLAAGDAAAGQNNAGFYIDQYNGAAQKRVLSIVGNGDFSVSANAYKPGGGSWSAPSDGRLKRNVRPIDGALDRLLELRGVRYEYTHPDGYLHPEGEHEGFIAQEVATVFPEWVGQSADGYLTVGPKGFEALSVEALRELRNEEQREVASLRQENDELRGRLAAIEARLSQSGGAR